MSCPVRSRGVRTRGAPAWGVMPAGRRTPALLTSCRSLFSRCTGPGRRGSPSCGRPHGLSDLTRRGVLSYVGLSSRSALVMCGPLSRVTRPPARNDCEKERQPSSLAALSREGPRAAADRFTGADASRRRRSGPEGSRPCPRRPFDPKRVSPASPLLLSLVRAATRLRPILGNTERPLPGTVPSRGLAVETAPRGGGSKSREDSYLRPQTFLRSSFTVLMPSSV